MAASATMTTARTPASTISPRRIWNWLEYTLHTTSAAMITLATTIAGIGEWVRSLTSASFSGMSRSNDQAKNDRIGMNVLAIIDGRLQNRNKPTMTIVTSGLFNNSATR